jgi:DNA-binding GntR family transcriptional regulator
MRIMRMVATVHGVIDLGYPVRGDRLLMPRPLTYVEIADELEARIHKGVYRPGEKLPTQRELAVAFGVSEQTISKATALVKDRGLVYSAPPRGVFVNE